MHESLYRSTSNTARLQIERLRSRDNVYLYVHGDTSNADAAKSEPPAVAGG